jgi:hypothetical protein
MVYADADRRTEPSWPPKEEYTAERASVDSCEKSEPGPRKANIHTEPQGT